METSSKPRQRVSTLLPIAEHRQSKVCDSSFLDEATFSAAQGKSSSGYGKKVVRPLVNLKKAFVEMLVSEKRSRDSVGNGSSYDNPAHWPAFSVGMGMVSVTYM